MTIERMELGNRVFFVDKEEKLIFTKTDLQQARKRYEREASRELKRRL